jgi:phage shock protein A
MHQSALTHRKIYATSEERKQRNRQAQAAFRERRTEYIKQLESTIKHHEDTLQNLQQSHRSAADECLMLRYKNSLLERILLEKGTIHLNGLPLAPGLTPSRY